LRISIFVWGVEGGAFARVAAGLSKGFVQHAVDVDVVYVHTDDYPQDLEFPSEVRLVHLGPRRTILSVPALARYLRERRPEAMISISFVQNAPAVLAKVLSRWNGMLLLNEVSNMSYKSGVEHRRDIRFRYMPSIARILYPRAQGLVAPSQDVLRDLGDTIGLARRRLPLRVIANPVDIDEVRLKAAQEPQSPDLLMPGPPLILGVGRLERQKNFGLLIRAFARLRKERPARLLILGSGPEKDSLQALIAKLGVDREVFLPGMARNPFPYMARADVFALSSEEEGFGLVLVEAMAVGLPIVATRCPGGPGEILEDGRSGILVAPGDERELAKSLSEVLDDEYHRRELVESGLRRAEHFSPSRIAAQWLSFMRTVPRASPAGRVVVQRGE
jgi:glycosyltransferase involved in cell wall biosynthesis